MSSQLQRELTTLRLDELKIVARELGCFVCVKGFSYLDKASLLNFILSKYNPIATMVGEKTLQEFFETILARFRAGSKRNLECDFDSPRKRFKAGYSLGGPTNNDTEEDTYDVPPMEGAPASRIKPNLVFHMNGFSNGSPAARQVRRPSTSRRPHFTQMQIPQEPSSRYEYHCGSYEPYQYFNSASHYSYPEQPAPALRELLAQAKLQLPQTPQRPEGIKQDLLVSERSSTIWKPVKRSRSSEAESSESEGETSASRSHSPSPAPSGHSLAAISVTSRPSAFSPIPRNRPFVAVTSVH